MEVVVVGSRRVVEQHGSWYLYLQIVYDSKLEPAAICDKSTQRGNCDSFCDYRVISARWVMVW